MNRDDLAGRILAHAFHDELEKIAGREERREDRKERRALRRGERIIAPEVGAGFGGAPLPEATPSREERMSRLQAIGEHARTLGEAKGNLAALDVPQRPRDISPKPVPAPMIARATGAAYGVPAARTHAVAVKAPMARQSYTNMARERVGAPSAAPQRTVSLQRPPTFGPV